MGYILSIDQGTTGTTSVLINDETFEFVVRLIKNIHKFTQGQVG